MSKCFQLNIKNIIFEASSIGLDKNRLEGLEIDHAIFTNISRDHLDYHGSLRNYVDAKFRLVSNTKAKTVAINFDDEIISSQLRKISSNQTFKISSQNNKSDIYFKVLKFYEDGNIKFLVETPWGKFEAASKIESEFNLYNLFLSLPYFQFINNDCEGFFAEVEKISLPIGRLNKTARENIYIDYAHSPEALESVCKYLYKKKKNKLVIVFGAGGERDKGKRGQMGEVADKYCEKIYITSDNPRNEDPQKIADMIIGGVKGFEKICVELDRASAIKNAINELSEEDILLIAGKGHENKQIIGNKCLDFSDFEEVKKCTA
jgi:UDP-N-acetylmuramoyl-L-alanyl-D-glutamate--2,6-diaminopimelate ligase